MEHAAANLREAAASLVWRPVGGVLVRLEYAPRRTGMACWGDEAVRLVLPANLARRERAYLLDRLFWGFWGRALAPVLQDLASRLNAAYFAGTLTGAGFHRQYRRWGSCSSRGRIYLSHRLLSAPDELIRPVLLHELAHLGRLDHSRLFWDRLAAADPFCRTRRRDLVLYGRAWSAWWEPRQAALLGTGRVYLPPLADWRSCR